jgi:DNA-binding NarL/FixJ family response regulator
MVGTSTIKILIVDDQQLIRQGLSTLLGMEEDLAIVGEAVDGTHAFLMVEKMSPDVVLMDLRMPACDGITATGRIKNRWPDIKILALTTFDDDELILDAIDNGASGYLLKDTPREQLASAIRALHQGNMYLGPTIAPKVISRLQKAPTKTDTKALSRMTPRELEIMSCIGQGHSNKEIAIKLNITEGTVKNHVSKVLTAIGARDRTQAALWAQENL